LELPARGLITNRWRAGLHLVDCFSSTPRCRNGSTADLIAVSVIRDLIGLANRAYLERRWAR
jgi:hypothetical protein